MLEWLGKFQKGWLTIVGAVVAAVGLFLGADVAGIVQSIADSIWTILLAIGSIVAVLGIGRKAGAEGQLRAIATGSVAKKWPWSKTAAAGRRAAGL